jgi:hypothetical protein
MVDSDETPTPRPRTGRLFWIAGLTLGIVAGAIVAVQLAMASAS